MVYIGVEGLYRGSYRLNIRVSIGVISWLCSGFWAPIGYRLYYGT